MEKETCAPTTTPFEDLRCFLTGGVFFNDKTVFLTPYKLMKAKEGCESWVKRCDHFVPLTCSEIEFFDTLPEDTDYCLLKSVNNAEDDYYIFNIAELKAAMNQLYAGPLTVCCPEGGFIHVDDGTNHMED